MGLTHTCKVCKKKVPIKESIKVKDRAYVCSQECYNKYLQKDTDKQSQIKSKVNEEQQYYRQLTDYIQMLYIEEGIDKDLIPWGMIGKQIQFLKSKYGYKYGGMLLTLQYYCEILEKQIKPEFGVQDPIEVFYEETKQNAYETLYLNQEMENFGEDIELRVQGYTQPKKTNKYLIDLNQL